MLRPVRAVSGPRADRLGTWLALPRRRRQQGPGEEKRVRAPANKEGVKIAVKPRRRRRLKSTHPDEERGGRESLKRPEEESEPSVYSSLLRGAPPLFSAHFPRLVLSPAPLRASPRSLSKGARPQDLGSAPHFVASVSPQVGNSRGGVSTSRKAGGRKKRQETRAYCSLFFSTGHTPAFSDPSQRGKARSVARGGWHSECHEWW